MKKEDLKRIVFGLMSLLAISLSIFLMGIFEVSTFLGVAVICFGSFMVSGMFTIILFPDLIGGEI